MSNFGTLIDQYSLENGKRLNHILRQILILTASLMLLLSCRERKPEGILSRAEMVQVMEELYIAEEKVNHLALTRDSAKQIAVILNRKVFEDASTTDSIFKQSLDYYMERPAELEKIYTALVDTLQLREHRAFDIIE